MENAVYDSALEAGQSTIDAGHVASDFANYEEDHPKK